MHVCLHFGSFLEEILGVLEFEIKIVVVGVGAETDFLNHHLLGFRLEFLLFLFLLVLELGVVNDTADGRIGGRGNLHQIKALRLGHDQGCRGVVNALLHIVAHQPHFGGAD